MARDGQSDRSTPRPDRLTVVVAGTVTGRVSPCVTVNSVGGQDGSVVVTVVRLDTTVMGTGSGLVITRSMGSWVPGTSGGTRSPPMVKARPGSVVRSSTAMPTTGRWRSRSATEPKNGASPKLNTPPSDAANQ